MSSKYAKFCKLLVQHEYLCILIILIIGMLIIPIYRNIGINGFDECKLWIPSNKKDYKYNQKFSEKHIHSSNLNSLIFRVIVSNQHLFEKYVIFLFKL